MATHAHSTDTSRRPATPPGTGGRRSLAAGIAALALAVPTLASTGLHTAKAAPTPTPDADLLRLYADHARNHAAVNALDAPDWEDEDHPMWLAYFATYRASRDSRPKTMKGVLAKAHLAWLEDEVPKDSDVGARDWAGTVVRDLLALRGGQ